jgi:hypothetical protein
VATTPTFKAENGIYRLEWKEEQVQIRIDRLLEEKDRITGEVTITTSAPSVGPHLLHQRINLLASRQPIVKTMESTALGALDWYDMVEQACLEVVDDYREGEPLIKVGHLPPDTSENNFVLWPLCRAGEPTVVYGESGQGKSFVGVLAAALVQSGTVTSMLMPYAPANVLYLDYEASPKEIDRRLHGFSRGFGKDSPTEFIYRFGTQTVSHDSEALRRIVVEQNIGLVVIDSLSMAVGGDLVDPHAIIAFFRALRTLKIASLIIHHENRQGGYYGSAYILAQTRSAWELKGAKEDNDMTIGLFHRKSNNGRLMEPIGLRFSFDRDKNDEESIDISKGDLLQFESTAQSMPLVERMKDLLEHGSRRADELAAELGEKEATVRYHLYRRTDLFVSLPGGIYSVPPTKKDEMVASGV